MHELAWIMFFCQEWGNLAMICENHWLISFRVTKQIVIRVNECVVLFLVRYFMSWTQTFFT